MKQKKLLGLKKGYTCEGVGGWKKKHNNWYENTKQMIKGKLKRNYFIGVKAI